jgi:chemotaxis response regulator CheB
MMPKKTQFGANGGRHENVSEVTLVSPVGKPAHAGACDRPAGGNQIVGIGASVGGLNPFTATFAKMPPDAAVAVAEARAAA